MKFFALVIAASICAHTGLCQNREKNDTTNDQWDKNYFLDPDGEYRTTYPSTVVRSVLSTKPFQDSVRNYLRKHFVTKAKEAHCSRIVVYFNVENFRKQLIRKYDVLRLE
jgi:hypothetical protein